jgi:hypothetical protein
MSWTVEFEDEFVSEFGRLSTRVQDALLAHASVLENEGPLLGRPLVDTLKNSAFPNMKELRFNVDQGVWRVAFAFDTQRKCVLLVAGNKVGLRDKAEVRFYQALIKSADARFARYLKTSQKVRSGHRKENKQCR